MDTNGNIKKLLIKDLSSRLPYNVICQVEFREGGKYNSKVMLLSGIFTDEAYFTAKGGSIYSNEYKPYLFPLSSMTEEQEKEIQEIVGNSDDACIIRKTYGLELWLNSIDTDPTIWVDTIFEVQDYLNKNHFDYRCLIEKGLAIEITEKNNPYKE